MTVAGLQSRIVQLEAENASLRHERDDLRREADWLRQTLQVVDGLLNRARCSLVEAT
jgi:cell division protein FtsB